MTRRALAIFAILVTATISTTALLGGIIAYAPHGIRGTKSDRLLWSRPISSYSRNYLASVPEIENAIDAPSAGKTEYWAAVPLIGVPLPPPKPKHLTTSGLLNDAQLVGIKNRLELSSQQAELWPPVEVALREVSRVHLQRREKHRKGAPPTIEINSPEVQRLIEVSTPLIRVLREDQKRRVRELVRMIGLTTVASQI